MRVRLRQKQLADKRISLYLDIYLDGKRYYEFLNLHLPKDRQERKEMQRLAEEIRSKRELELQSAEHGYVPRFKQATNFIAYFEELAATRHKTWRTVLLQMREFAGDDVLASQRTPNIRV